MRKITSKKHALVIALALVGLAIAPGQASALDGMFDTRFSGDGLRAIGGAPSTQIRDAAALSNGRMVAVGSFTTGEVMVVLPNGNLDSSFSGDGIADVPSMTVSDVAVQTDGKIVVSGQTDAVPQTAALSRLTTTGTPDSTFFTASGFKAVDLHPSTATEEARDVAVAPSGKIVVVGVQPGVQRDWAIAQLNSNGRPDEHVLHRRGHQFRP